MSNKGGPLARIQIVGVSKPFTFMEHSITIFYMGIDIQSKVMVTLHLIREYHHTRSEGGYPISNI